MYESMRDKFLGLSLQSTRKSYYPQLQKQLEAATESERRLQLLIDSMPARISFVDKTSCYVFVNKTYEKDFGLTRDQIVGMHMSALIGNENYAIAKPHIAQSMQGKIVHYENEFKNVSGAPLWLDVTYVPDMNRSGTCNGLYVLALDITEKKQAEQEKRKLESQLQQAQKMEAIGSLAGGIAHDFNNMLFPITGLSEMLLDDLPGGSPEHEKIEKILHAAKRAADLAQQILSFSRQSHHDSLPVRVQDIIKEVCRLTRSTLPSNVAMVRHIDKSCGPIHGDPSQVYQVALNLITNAFHAVEETNGTITISLSEMTFSDVGEDENRLPSGRYLHLFVSDNGVGIAPENLDKIFEPYFTTKPKGKGTGLGLAMVYGIVKKYGGEITVVSQINEGTTVNVYLPLLDPTEREPVILETSSLETGSEQILLVDDDKAIVELETLMLERLGYQVTAHISSVEALALFKSDPHRFDLVISDMTMPHITGDQLAREILAIRSDIPILICTGYNERLDNTSAKEMGIKGVLIKPVSMVHLGQMVRKALGNPGR